MYQFMLLPIEGHLGYFHFLKIMNNTTLNMHEQVFMWTHGFMSLITVRGIAGSCNKNSSKFDTVQLFSSRAKHIVT